MFPVEQSENRAGRLSVPVAALPTGAATRNVPCIAGDDPRNVRLYVRHSRTGLTRPCVNREKDSTRLVRVCQEADYGLP